MAQITRVGEHAIPHGESSRTAGADSAWGKFARGVSRVFFWAYERGTWQYDLIVVAIVAFIFLTPRIWFNDRPTLQLTDLRHSQGIVEVNRNDKGGAYLVDARLVESMSPAKTEDALHSIVQSRVSRAFSIKAIDPVRDRHNVMLGYTVSIVFK